MVEQRENEERAAESPQAIAASSHLNTDRRQQCIVREIMAVEFLVLANGLQRSGALGELIAASAPIPCRPCLSTLTLVSLSLL
jgi:hypothetical protein